MNPERTESFFGYLRGVDFAQRWVMAGDVSTRILETGRDRSDALVFLHGIGGHAEAFIRNLDSHGQHFHTYSIDMVGHGYTDKPPLDYEIPDYLAHLLAFLDAENLERVSISGESLGGWVAAEFAARYPERVDRLVLNTAGGRTFNLEVMDRIKTLSLAAVRNPDWDTVRKRLEWLMADPSTVTDELVATRLAIYSQPGFEQAMEGLMRLQDPDIRRRNLVTDETLTKIQAPTLVLWTSHDPSGAKTVGQELARLIPGARFEIMEDCGHWPQFEDPDEFDRIHLDFLRDAVSAA